MPKVKIRTAEIRDLDDIFFLLQQLWPDKELNRDKLKAVFIRGIESQSDKYFCAEVNGKIVGFCSFIIKNSFWQEGYIGWISELVVDNSFRGQGIGTALVEAAGDTARDKGCRKIELDSGFHRQQAHNFYKKLGFEKRAHLFSKEI